MDYKRAGIATTTEETTSMEETKEEAIKEEAATEEATTERTTGQEASTEEATAEDAMPVHPYKDKLATFKPQEWQMKKQIPQASPPLDDNTYTFVDSVTSLNEMMTDLKKVKEVAIATQFEFTHFYPCCCLLEISTRKHDYIIDAIKLKEELKVLNEITSDESIMKVLYSTGIKYSTEKFGKQGEVGIMANSLGLWVVNLFEIIAAGGILKDKGEKLSTLSELLKKHCFVDLELAKKKPCFMDEKIIKGKIWMNRPLSEDQINYLRMKVHYMLYIHDIYRNELVEKGLLEKLYEQCTQFCKTSMRSGKDCGSHLKLYESNYKKQGEFNHRQMECLRLLFNWRYETAKKNNKALPYILNTKDMYNLAKELPAQVDGVAKCFGDEVLPPFVESDLQIVHGLILQAIKEVTDLSIVKIGSFKRSASKRSSTSDKTQNSNSAKRGRGGNHRGQRGNINSGSGPMRGRGHLNSGTVPLRGRGHMNPGPGPIRGRGYMNSGPGLMRGQRMPRQPWMHPPMGRGMGPQMGPGYGQRMGPMMGNMSQGQGHEMSLFGPQKGPTGAKGGPGFLDQVINDVVGKMTQRMTQQAMSYSNNMNNMMNSRGRGGLQGGRGGSQGGLGRPSGGGYGRR